MKDNTTLAAMLTLILLVFSPLGAHAHRVSVFAWVDGDEIHTESKFGGGKPVVGGSVKVFDMQGEALLEGKTDENGEFSFPIPVRKPLRIELEAGMGHGNQWLVTAEEIGASKTQSAREEKAEAPETPSGAGADETSAAAPDAAKTVPTPAAISPEELEAMVARASERGVEKALDRKMKPVVKLLSDLRDPGPGATEIFGGIGYILGLVGIAAYFKSRGKTGAGNG